jgi:hypothetical protein
MTGAELAYLAARVLSCGIWVAAGLHKATHYRNNIVEMGHLGVPLPRLVLPCVLILEMVGALLLIVDQYVCRLSPGSFSSCPRVDYHFRFVMKDGTMCSRSSSRHEERRCGWAAGAILLDTSRPAWLFPG